MILVVQDNLSPERDINMVTRAIYKLFINMALFNSTEEEMLRNSVVLMIITMFECAIVW